MKKLISVVLALIALTGSLPVLAREQRQPLDVQQCSIHAPYGLAKTNVLLKPICRQAYLSMYDPQAKIPLYVEWTVTPVAVIGCEPRSNAFASDDSILNSPTPEDYAGSGYDKGHMSPNADQSWSQQTEYESFLMTNMAPQAPSFNRGVWKLLETSVRAWAVVNNRPFTVISGSVYDTNNKRIGKGVVVPHAYYKIVMDTKTGQVAGWYFPHVAPYPNLGTDLTKYRASIADIETRAKIDFPFPTNIRELPVGSEWSTDFGKLLYVKKTYCGRKAKM